MRIIQIQAFQPTEMSWHALVGLDEDGKVWSRTCTKEGWSEWACIDQPDLSWVKREFKPISPSTAKEE